MSYRMRTMLLVAVIELGLLMFFFTTADMPGDKAGRAQAIFSVMGVILGLTPLLFIFALKNDRRKAAERKD